MAPRSANTDQADNAPGFRVLLIDDDITSREKIRRAVFADFPRALIDEIPDHVTFFRALQGINFDLVITEQDVHWSTGSEVLAAVKSLRPTIPVIFLAANEDEKVASEAFKAGLHAYILKSDDLQAELAPAIRSAVQISEYEERVVTLEERLHDVLESLNIGVFRSTVEGRLLEANTAFLRLLGFDSLDQAKNLDLGSLYVQPGIRRELLERLTEAGQVRDQQAELRRRDGSTVWVSLTQTCVTTEAGDLEIDGVADDVGKKHQAQETLARGHEALEAANMALAEGHRALEQANKSLQQSNDQYRAIFETASAATVIIDEDLTVSMANSAFAELTGYDRDEIEDRKMWTEFVAQNDLEQVRDLQRRRREGDATVPRTVEFKLVNRAGQIQQVRSTEALLPGTRRVVASVLNLTARRQAEEQVLHNAFHDALTGLPNRFQIQDRIEDILADGDQFALLLFDLDRFKVINDSLGHSVGDQLLKAVTERFRRDLDSIDTLARVEGNTFAAIVCPVEHADDASAVAATVKASLVQPFDIAENTIFCSASIGIVLSSEGATSDDLLRNAEAAMNRAKRLDQDRWVVFEPAMHERAKRVFKIENELRQAISNGELRLHYQPIVTLQNRSTIGFDALVRWQHPESGLLLPDAFLDVAEDSGQIVPLGRWVLSEACRTLHQWHRSGTHDSEVFVNVKLTMRQYAHPDLVEDVHAALADTGLPATSLMLGLRENALHEEPEAAAETIARLRALDVQLCIDDFGSGYSSLPHLHRQDFTTVKTDRAFLVDIGDDADRWSCVDVLNRIGTHLGVRVIAKGIEQPAQLDRLLSMGYAYGQGHLFAKPTEKLSRPGPGHIKIRMKMPR